MKTTLDNLIMELKSSYEFSNDPNCSIAKAAYALEGIKNLREVLKNHIARNEEELKKIRYLDRGSGKTFGVAVNTAFTSKERDDYIQFLELIDQMIKDCIENDQI